jgi:hypothetical protein
MCQRVLSLCPDAATHRPSGAASVEHGHGASRAPAARVPLTQARTRALMEESNVDQDNADSGLDLETAHVQALSPGVENESNEI